MINTEKTKPIEQAPHQAARPRKIVVDNQGYPWLCDRNVNPEKNPQEQGCWACEGTEMPFARDD